MIFFWKNNHNLNPNLGMYQKTPQPDISESDKPNPIFPKMNTQTPTTTEFLGQNHPKLRFATNTCSSQISIQNLYMSVQR